MWRNRKCDMGLPPGYCKDDLKSINKYLFINNTFVVKGKEKKVH